MSVTEERVDRLERIVEEFVSSVGVEFNKLYNSQMRTEAEFREFKEEMRDFKDEMRSYKEENRLQIRQMNIKWGEIARKLGTVTEDLVAPSIPRIVQEEFGLEVTDLMIRRKKKLADGRTKEYDAIAVAGEYVFVDSTKSTLDSDGVREFVQDVQEFRGFFPEYAKNKVVGILASLYADEGILAYAGKMGFMVIAVGDNLMDVKNPKGFKPKEW